MTSIELCEVTGGRRDGPGLAAVNLKLVSGEIVGILGAGADGRAALLDLLSGRITPRPRNGIIMWNGKVLEPGEHRLRAGVAAGAMALPRFLTVEEWFGYLAAQVARSGAERTRLVREGIEFGALPARARSRISTLSRSEYRRAAMAAAVITGRELVLLDDLLRGHAGQVLSHLIRGLRDIAARGGIVVLGAPDPATLEPLVHRVVYLSHGRIAHDLDLGQLLGERVAEVLVTRRMSRLEPLASRFAGAELTSWGLKVPLRGGLTLETVLAHLRKERIPVAGTRTRNVRLADLRIPGDVGQPRSRFR